MNSPLRIFLFVAAFFSAAKAHGRHLRLERELFGIWEVDFREPGNPWIVARWRHERRLFWVLAAAVFACLLWRGWGQGSPYWAVAFFKAMVAAFALTSLASAVRLWLRLKQGAVEPS